MSALKKRLLAQCAALLCALFFYAHPAPAFFDEQFPDQNDNLIFSQENTQTESFTTAPADIADLISSTASDAVAEPPAFPSFSGFEETPFTTQEDEKLAQLLLLQELSAPFSSFANDTTFAYGNTAGYVDPFNLQYGGVNRPLYLSKYRFKRYNDPMSNFDDLYEFNNPMLHFYFDNPNLAPEDWLDQFGSGQKYHFRKFKPLRPMGTAQY